ncbi:MAG TPA: UDP-glucuronic acid decarboxylase family protein, partial [Pirellulales bacterium]
MRIVVTGGSGFIGSHLCERLLREGHEVVCLDSFITGSPENTEPFLSNPRFSRIECDVSDGLPVEGTVDRIYHMASPASPVGYMKNPFVTLKVGSYATFHCCELARQNNARVLVASTSEIYGDPLEHPQKESYWGNVNSIGPRSVYDEAKRFAESVMMAYHTEYNVATRIVRIFNTYGPRMQLEDGRALPAFFSQALRNEPITVFGDGSQTRSFCYVTDLVDGIIRLMESDYHLPVNIGNPVEITIREVVDEVLRITGSTSEVTYHPLPQDDPKLRRPDITLARKVLGWEPKVDRAEGLEKTLAFFREMVVK